MPSLDIMSFPEQEIFGYIESPFLSNVRKMLDHILFYDYEKYQETDSKGWTGQLIEDLLKEINIKPFITVALSVGPDMSIRARDLDPLGNTALSGKLTNKTPWTELNSYWKTALNEYLPNCNSAIVSKHSSHLIIATKFSLRRMCRYAQRITKEKFTEQNPDAFMQSMLKLVKHGENLKYDYRLRASATWANDTTLHYYGMDYLDPNVLHYDSTDHIKVIYVASGHEAATINGISCPGFPAKEASK